ncbi:hypothetical protein BYT27DRAFT_7225117 [Phlegmacium glaucopus]|nr:hypothetical protein BYT27DRAFT_7225117 [Phlegmacium glaucopus]
MTKMIAIITKKSIEHEPQHDIESFIHVPIYSMTRKVVLESRSLDEDMCKKLHQFFHSTFGWMKLYDIWISRKGQVPFSIEFLFQSLITAPMVELLVDLDGWLLHSRLPLRWNPTLLIYTYLLSALDN